MYFFFVLVPIAFQLRKTTVYAGSGQVDGLKETLIILLVIQGDSLARGPKLLSI